MSHSAEGEKENPSVLSRATAFFVLTTGGIVTLFALLRLAAVLVKGIIWLLGSFAGSSRWVDLLVGNVTVAFLATFLILAVVFGVFLKAILLRRVPLLRRLRDTAFGPVVSKPFSLRR